ncbi:MAG: NUDIX domain-containing protein [Hyphomicrobiales bacterium]|nr:NUDIX domain-containing protein [Hyphomicrobiales bacterium]
MEETVIARPAATVLLVRDGASGLEVFMVVRHHQIDFASGALVFPGGSVEPEDTAIAADPERCAAGPAIDERGRALRVAAIRETFEECGVLLARPRGASELIGAERCAAIRAAAKGVTFAELIRREDLSLALDALTPFAHWITPPILRKRFDTHFFIAAAPRDQLARHDGHESGDSTWINPRRALADAAAGTYTMVLPTRLNAQMLGESGDVAAALAAAQTRRIVTVEPAAVKSQTGFTLTIPRDAGYGERTTFSM